MRNIKAAFKRTRFPILAVDDLLFKLKNAKSFTNLDQTAAFYQKISIFQWEDRLKWFERFISGWNSAPE